MIAIFAYNHGAGKIDACSARMRIATILGVSITSRSTCSIR
jgi:hypothetical protein